MTPLLRISSMKKILIAIVASATLAFAPTAASAADPVPVIPNAPVVSQTYGTCWDGEWIIEPALVTLPAVENGRWYDPTTEDPTDITPTTTFLSEPGEYTYGFIPAEGDFFIPASPGGADDYRLENGVAYYTITINSVEEQDCDIAQTVLVVPIAPIVRPGWGECVAGKWVRHDAYVTLPQINNGSWLDRVTEFYAFPGVYTFGFEAYADTETENFVIPNSTNGSYVLKGETAFFTVIINPVEAQNCVGKDKGPKPPKNPRV